MTFFVCLMLLSGSFVLVFSQSPFYSLLGVLVVALTHSVYLAYLGGPFYSALIIIIYAGGMLVVFLFSTILSADRHLFFPKSYFIPSLLGGVLISVPFINSYVAFSFSDGEPIRGNWIQLVNVFSSGGFVLCVVGGALLLCLMGILLVGFEHGRKQLRRL